MPSDSERTISIDFAELEAFHDVIEAASCYWHQREPSERAANTLRIANQLYWTIGEYLPKSGAPSSRFEPVPFDDSKVGRLLDFVQNLTADYTKEHDPWWADTVIVAQNFATMLPPDDWRVFVGSLRRLGLTIEIDSTLPPNRMVAERRNRGPWPEQSD
jgi:hypothetical protein